MEGIGALSASPASGGVGAFVQLVRRRAQAESPAWQLPTHDARRAHSREPRVVQQVALERAFAAGVAAGVWRTLRSVALPARHYVLTRGEFVEWLRSCGVSSAALQRGLLELFRTGLQARDDGISALAVCKAVELALLAERERNEAMATVDDVGGGSSIVAHCYRTYRLACDSHHGHRHQPRHAASNGDGDKDGNDDALVACVLRACRVGKGAGDVDGDIRSAAAAATVVSWPTFVRAFYRVVDDDNVAASGAATTAAVSGDELSLCLVKPILEACNKYMRAPLGRFPVLAPRWLHEATVPLEHDATSLADADALLLRDADAAAVTRARTRSIARKRRGTRKRSSARRR